MLSRGELKRKIKTVVSVASACGFEKAKVREELVDLSIDLLISRAELCDVLV